MRDELDVAGAEASPAPLGEELYTRRAAFDAPALRRPTRAGCFAPTAAMLKAIGVGASLLLLAVAAVALARSLAHVRFDDLGAALQETSAGQIALALLFTAFSYLALTGYDALALRVAGARPPYRVTALASFASFAISFNVGFAVVTAPATRYWVYKRAGVTAAQVANVTLAAGVTFWLGMSAAFGVGMLFGGEALAAADGLHPLLNALLGVAALGAIAAYCAFVAAAPRRLQLRGHALQLPGPAVTLGQVALGVADLFPAAAALYVLLPAGHGFDFLSFVALYVFACILGVASHAPGGIGVFEATLLHAVHAPSQEGLLAALLLFRIVYYLLPFTLALALLGAAEGRRRWSLIRAALSRFGLRGFAPFIGKGRRA